jgi:hypothetical protein
VAFTLLTACSGIDVNTDYDLAADFSKLKSYAWLTPEPESADPRTNNSLLGSRIRDAVDHELEAKGYERVDEGEPDCLVAWHVTVDRKLSVQTVDYGYGYYWGPGYGSETRVQEYEEGSLIVDILTPGKPQLIWRGTASTRLQPNQSPEDRVATINEAARLLFEKYPPLPR